jgi:hypothetical protein
VTNAEEGRKPMKSSVRDHLSIFVQRRRQLERRGSKRIAPVHRTCCLIQSSGEEQMSALVHNISCQGIALQAEQGYSSGTLLHLLIVNEAHTSSLHVDLNVIRSIRMGDRYVIAGSFVRPLSHEEVVPFIL